MKDTIHFKSKILISILGKDKIERQEELYQTFPNDFIFDASKYNINEQELLSIIDDWKTLNKDDLIFLYIKNLPEELKQKQILYSIKQRVDDYISFEGQKEYEQKQQFDMDLPVRLKEGMEKYFGRDKFSFVDVYKYSMDCDKQTIYSIEEFNFWNSIPNLEMLPNKIEVRSKEDLKAYLELLGDNKNINTIVIDNMSILTIEQIKLLSQEYNINNVVVAAELGKPEKAPDKYMYTIDEYINMRERIDEILADVDMTAPEIERFLTIYKKIGETIEYAIDEDGEPCDDINCHNLKGGLLEGKCVCEGYALILQQVLKCAKIECKYIDGFSGVEGHAWNQVKIGEKWYNCDLTWDADKIRNGCDLEYCLQSDEEFILHDSNLSSEAQTCLESYDINEISKIMYRNKVGIKETRKFMEWYFKGQSLLKIDDFKERCLKYGLDFEEEMNKAKDKVKLQAELDKTNGEIPEDKKTYFRKWADQAQLDLNYECLEAMQRKILREYIKGKQERSQEERDYISNECEALGLNFNYEIIDYAQESNQRKVAILPEQIGRRTIDASSKIKQEVANIEKIELAREGLIIGH